MDARLERDDMVFRQSAETAGEVLASSAPRPAATGADEPPLRVAAVPARLAPQTAAPMRAPAATEAEDPVVRATRAMAANMMIGPRMMMAMASMTPYPFAWSPSAWHAALAWPATAHAAFLALAAANPLAPAPVVKALAPPAPTRDEPAA